MIAKISFLFPKMTSLSRWSASQSAARVKIACILGLAVSAGTACAAPVPTQAGNGISNVIWKMPEMPQPEKKKNFDPALIPIWRQVLAHRDLEMQQVACRGIRRMAADGMPGLQVLEPDLEKLAAKAAFPAVGAAAVGAVAELADPATKAFLSRMDRQKPQTLLILAADPLLAKWKSHLMFATWVRRAGDVKLALAIRLSAIRSLAIAGDSAAARALADLAANAHNPLTLRLAAAAALAELNPHSAGTLAIRRFSHPAAGAGRSRQRVLQDGLMALTLCRPAIDPAQQAVLVRLTGAKRNVLVQGAMAALVVDHAELMIHQAQAAALNPTPEIRRLVAQVLVRHILYVNSSPQPGQARAAAGKSIKLIGQLLNDHRRFVRWYCRHELIALGKKSGLRAAVLSQCRSQLLHGGPRGARQAAMVLGGLLDRASEPQLLHAALSGPRVVRVGAVVALRELRISAPLPALLAYAHKLAMASRKNVAKSQAGGFHAGAFRDENIQLAQIFQLIGLLHWRQGAAYLRTFIPKTQNYSGTARASAIWALGRIYHARPHRHLISELSERLNDITPLNPESPAVRAMAAVVIGELGRPADADTVYVYYGPHAANRIGMSCRWAYTRLTGKPLAIPVETTSPRTGEIMAIDPVH